MNQDITGLLVEWREGNKEAGGRLFSLIYDELHRVAHRHLFSEPADRTLNTTAVVHETYLRLVDQSQAGWSDRGHFLAVASRVMRHIVIDNARRHRSAKRGGEMERIDFDESSLPVSKQSSMLVALDDALNRLAEIDERLIRVVECRFFGGLTDEETAHALGVNARTVRRDWLKAKGWLLNALEG